MQIVIDIAEDCYKAIKDDKMNYDTALCGLKAIANGTPLPKGHGRLIDADELKKHKYHDSNRFENAVAVYHIDNAPTIIEADKEDSHDE